MDGLSKHEVGQSDLAFYGFAKDSVEIGCNGWPLGEVAAITLSGADEFGPALSEYLDEAKRMKAPRSRSPCRTSRACLADWMAEQFVRIRLDEIPSEFNEV